MSWQRRHGQEVQIWPQQTTVDRRGNRTVSVNMTAPPLSIKVAIVPDRSSRAEVPGQLEVNVYNMITDADLSGIGLWSRVLWRGHYWDVSAPPAYHHGTRGTRHWTVQIRERPEEGLSDGEESSSG